MNLTKKSVRKSVDHEISEWLYNTRESVEVKPTQGLFNYMCHHNAVQYAIDNKGCNVVMGIYVEDGYTTLHYWNVDSNGKHLETTRGWCADSCSYYILKIIPAADYKGISEIFSEALEYFTNRFTTRFQRIILGSERVL